MTGDVRDPCLAPSLVSQRGQHNQHAVQFYERDEFLAEVVARFVAAGLAAGDRVFVFATQAHVRGVREHFQKHEWEVALASKRLEALAAKYKADVTIWPVDFGSVFSVSGGLPLPKRSPQRQAYRMMELKRWRDHLGIKLTLEPKFFPADEVPAARCVIALREQGRMADAIKLAHAVLAALWAEEKNTGDPATLEEIIAGCEGIIPGPEPAHAIKATIDEALAAREAGEQRTILFGLCGHGNFDLSAYDAYLAGELRDPEFPQAELDRALASLPDAPALS